MRVAVILEQCLQPSPGGTGRYARELAAALAAHAPKSDDTVLGLVAWHRDVSAAVVPGVFGPRRLPLPRRALALAWERALGPIPRGAYLVHAPTLLMPSVRRSSRLAGTARRLAVTIHDAVPWTHPETLTPRGVAFHRRMAALAERYADLVIAPTEAVRGELAGLLNLGDRLTVVPPGLSPALQQPADAAERRRRLGLPDAYVLSVSTLEPRKGLDLLIEAVAQLTNRTGASDAALVVAGAPGWGEVDLDGVAARVGLAPSRLRVLGRISDADLAACYAGARVFAMPSRAEGFGLPVLEAMSLGAPVVCTTVPALIEVASGAAELTEPSVPALTDALERVWTDDSLRARLAAAGRGRAAAYDWTHSADRLWALYRDL